MRKIISLAAGAAMLAGCTSVSTIPGEVSTFISNVQATVVAACVVEPTAASIAALISASAVVGTVSEIAATICGAVNAVKSSQLGHRYRATTIPPPPVSIVVQSTTGPQTVVINFEKISK